ncbi:hypothetical protein [Paenibacillus sp. PAMC21692]|uniref:hypothetical protein n=1 Tax=Paenibacillus sp. PAMC21692 TaxID=2762320 RepID=UPI00164D5F4C|nr:hypothetical protein [Paenibacillus sp. PAMC21692]QNK55867.1 hypothetical protein H7F31_25230 [Paenibacillus sp. PAMC21692]
MTIGLVKHYRFRTYNKGMLPVQIVTPDDGYYIHNFFDVKPWSPSGRYLAVLKLPFQDKLPGPDDESTVCMIDLQEQSIVELCKTTGWGIQVGAHLCWGGSDDELFFNDKEADRVFAYKLNPHTGEKVRIAGSVYQASKDGRYIYSPNLSVINYAQMGYGATLAPEYSCPPPIGASEEDGLWRTDVGTNCRELVFSYKQALDLLPDKRDVEGARFTFFHVKINPQQTRLMQVVRCLFDDERRELRFIITMNMDGSDAKLSLPYEFWLDGSHHPDWHTNGKEILMNIQLNRLRFCLFAEDGQSFRLAAPFATGGGHPSFSNDGRYILTDAYTTEKEFVNERFEVPIRLIDTIDGSERRLVDIWTLGGTEIHGSLRCDPHPVWSEDNKYICFNGTPEGRRQVLIAEVGHL